MGLSPKKVELVQYKSTWNTEFLKEKEALDLLFKDDIVTIEHVGSTSIPNIKAKPIIDIVVGLKQFEYGERYIEPLLELGYIFKGHLGKSRRYFFSKGNDIERTHHLHLVEFGDRNWKNQILFRDYLLANSDIAKEYNELKQLLEEKYSDDRTSYTDKKSKFVLEIISKAKKIDLS